MQWKLLFDEVSWGAGGNSPDIFIRFEFMAGFSLKF